MLSSRGHAKLNTCWVQRRFSLVWSGLPCFPPGALHQASDCNAALLLLRHRLPCTLLHGGGSRPGPGDLSLLGTWVGVAPFPGILFWVGGGPFFPPLPSSSPFPRSSVPDDALGRGTGEGGGVPPTNPAHGFPFPPLVPVRGVEGPTWVGLAGGVGVGTHPSALFCFDLFSVLHGPPVDSEVS